jgi:hypothetical protein
LREARQFAIVTVPKTGRPGVGITIERSIDGPVTVIVQTITPVRSLRAYARIGVQAVATASSETVFVIIKEVREPITIAVGLCSTDSNGARSNRRIAVVTIPLTDRVAVSIEIPGVVDQSVAVVVPTVAKFCRTRKYGGLFIITVPLTAAYLIAILINVLIHISVAVIVQTILTVLKPQRSNKGVEVITVRGHTKRSTTPKAIAIDILLISGQRAVTVRVETVTDLDRLRIDQGHPRLAVLTVWAAIPILVLVR